MMSSTEIQEAQNLLIYSERFTTKISPYSHYTTRW